MAERKDGGPAFPEPERMNTNGEMFTREHGYRNEGMSLRDYFAAHAPDPSRADVNFVLGLEPGHEPSRPESIHGRVLWRWRWADAMLEAGNG